MYFCFWSNRITCFKFLRGIYNLPSLITQDVQKTEYLQSYTVRVVLEGFFPATRSSNEKSTQKRLSPTQITITNPETVPDKALLLPENVQIRHEHQYIQEVGVRKHNSIAGAFRNQWFTWFSDVKTTTNITCKTEKIKRLCEKLTREEKLLLAMSLLNEISRDDLTELTTQRNPELTSRNHNQHDQTTRYRTDAEQGRVSYGDPASL